MGTNLTIITLYKFWSYMRSGSKNLVILGMQWGDEGKGKIIDLLSRNFSYVVRFQGGNNAGHTIVVNGETLALHQVPSGTLHPKCFLVVANGVVLNLEVFNQEIDRLKQRGVDVLSRLMLSEKAHVILPHHILLDQWREGGAGRIGTTGRGIGPAYEMKSSRMGVRLGDFLHPETLHTRMELGYREVAARLGSQSALPSLEEIIERTQSWVAPLKRCIGNTQTLLYDAWEQKSPILFEGAQASLLDIDHGTYPYVTSSNCSVGGLLAGTGLSHHAIDMVCGVTKAYATRVGDGPFPSEIDGSLGETIRTRGKEFGTTTGRPRRCGWFDIPVVRHGVQINGAGGLAIMKLDVLDGLEEIKIILGYSDGSGGFTRHLPGHESDWKEVSPIEKTFRGWGKTAACKQWSDLPKEAQTYLKFIEDNMGCPIAYVSTGADRREGFFMSDILSSFMEPS